MTLKNLTFNGNNLLEIIQILKSHELINDVLYIYVVFSICLEFSTVQNQKNKID